MSTATATKPREIKTSKYPGWSISRVGTDSYLMTRPGGIFAIGVGYSDEQGWEGVLLTRQRGGWMPAKTPYRHAVIGCVQEADRRERHIRKYAARPLAGATK